MKQEVAEILKNALKKLKIDLTIEEIEKSLETPKDSSLGDYAFPCFFLASKLKQNPKNIALKLRELIGNSIKPFDDIQAVNGYLNFFTNKQDLSSDILKEILLQKEKYGILNSSNKKLMIEFPSPNTNKPLHLGHLRNMSIGESMSRISEFNGFKLIRANLNNDRGIHICKSMLAYQKFGKNKKPTKKIKSDHFVGDFYVLFNEKLKKDKNLETEAQELLKKYEAGDKKTIALWKKMNKWAFDGFNATYKKFGIKLDKEYYESNLYEKGKEIILDGFQKNIFKKNDEGAIIVDLNNKGLGEKVLLRADGTSIYITQDIYLAKLKFDEFGLDKSIYVVANEQDYHFNVLFEILEMLGIASKEKLKHLSYGMVFLPSGRMKSREGTVVDADELIEEIRKLMEKELKARGKLSKKEFEKRSLIVALAAIKYFLLKIDAKKNMIFNPEESINLEGDTGPYLLYSYARASSILRKAKKLPTNFKTENLEQSEIELIKKLSNFKELVVKSYNSLNPSLIANYSYELCQTFNAFYHDCPVIGSETESFRLKLVEAFRIVLKNSLYLLGIDVLEKM